MDKITTICTLIVLLLAVPSHADVFFTTLGPGDLYDTGHGWGIGSPFSGTQWDQGDRFSFAGPSSYFLDTIELAVSHIKGTNEIDVWLMDDVAGEPGSIIEAFNFTDLGPFGNDNPLLIGNSILRPVLNPGTNYWLIASAPNTDDTLAAWNRSSPGVQGLHGRYTNGSFTSLNETMGAFRVQGTLVPVPGAVLLGLLGLSAAGMKLRRFA